MASDTLTPAKITRHDTEHTHLAPPHPARGSWASASGTAFFELLRWVHHRSGNNVLKPRICCLRHHAPKALQLPPHYFQEPPLTNGPKFSIVTPSYNQADYLGRTIDSVLGQNYQQLEYIVQDGNSTDDSRGVLSTYNDRVNWVSQPDHGQSDAINRGFAKCSGEIMAWLNSDDLLLPGALNFVARYFQDHPEVDVIYGHRILIDQHDQEIGRWILPPHQDHSQRWVDTIPQETMFWRRRIWDRVGGINANFQFAMDWDLILRFIEAGANFVRLPRFIGAFRVHEQQKTSARAEDLGRPEILSLRQRTLGCNPSRALIARQVSTYLAQHMLLHTGYRMGLIKY